jgi:hypothetical protein
MASKEGMTKEQLATLTQLLKDHEVCIVSKRSQDDVLCVGVRAPDGKGIVHKWIDPDGREGGDV